MAQIKKYKKLGGGSLRLKIDGKSRIIKPNEIFTALESEIPATFLNSLEEVEGSMSRRKTITTIDSVKTPVVDEVEEVVKAEVDVNFVDACPYKAVDLGTGWWEVQNAEGKVISESKLRHEKAILYIQDLMAE